MLSLAFGARVEADFSELPLLAATDAPRILFGIARTATQLGARPDLQRVFFPPLSLPVPAVMQKVLSHFWDVVSTKSSDDELAGPECANAVLRPFIAAPPRRLSRHGCPAHWAQAAAHTPIFVRRALPFFVPAGRPPPTT
jgi:hypothetical protein